MTTDIATRLTWQGYDFREEARQEIVRLRSRINQICIERDEARREVSFLRPSVCLGAQTAHEYAESRGWDCFEEDGK